MENNKIAVSVEQQFGEVIDIILRHKSRASKVVNEELLLTAWHVGGYVSAKLKNEEWGSRVVTLLSEYIRSKRPDLKGYSRRSIYNMVMFYDAYSTPSFLTTVEKFLSSEFVQPETAQIVQPEIGQMPKILELTTLTNHIEILCRCKSNEERMFYILYANKEHLVKRELQRCISNQTFTALLGNKDNISKGFRIARNGCRRPVFCVQNHLAGANAATWKIETVYLYHYAKKTKPTSKSLLGRPL